MIAVTPAGRTTYTNQDTDEVQRLAGDVSASRRDYLAHPDAEVRSLADWYLRYSTSGPSARDAAFRRVWALYRRLQHLAAGGTPGNGAAG